MRKQSAYGAHRNIQCKYRDTPFGFTESAADLHQMRVAGFHQVRPGAEDIGAPKPGEQPLSELVIDGRQMVTPDIAARIMRDAHFIVLRDIGGSIVATWDEGRWWTPDESAEFQRQLVAEMRAAA